MHILLQYYCQLCIYIDDHWHHTTPPLHFSVTCASQSLSSLHINRLLHFIWYLLFLLLLLLWCSCFIRNCLNSLTSLKVTDFNFAKISLETASKGTGHVLKTLWYFMSLLQSLQSYIIWEYLDLQDHILLPFIYFHLYLPEVLLVIIVTLK